jgi:DegV family protein with EDD domain
MARIRIVADSACDIPQDIVEKYGISVIPAYINFGLESIPDDGVSITREAFYERLKTADPLPTTSAPPPGVSEQIMRAALADADHVVAIHVASKLSGIFNTSRVAAEAIDTERISLFDTGQASMGAGWAAIAAAEAADRGADVDAVIAAAQSTNERTTLWAVPITMEYLRRSGRVNALVAGLGEMLQIKPIISVDDGEANSAGRVRTTKKVIEKLIEMTREQAPLERLAVLHLNNQDGAALMRAALSDVAPPDNTVILMASSAVGANFGPGGLGIALVRAAS